MSYQSIVDYWFEQFEALVGHKPLFTAKEGGVLKSLLEGKVPFKRKYTEDDVKLIINIMLEKKICVSFTALLSPHNFNRVQKLLKIPKESTEPKNDNYKNRKCEECFGSGYLVRFENNKRVKYPCVTCGGNGWIKEKIC